MSDSEQFNQDSETFQQVLDAVAETPRGRWFLQEFLKRNRVSDTEQVLLAIEQLKVDLTPSQASDTTPDILKSELHDMANAIHQTRAEIAETIADYDDAQNVFSENQQVDVLTNASEKVASDTLAIAERLRDLAEQLNSNEATMPLAEEFSTLSANLFIASSVQNIVGQHAAHMAALVAYLEQSMEVIYTTYYGAAEQEVEDYSDPVDYGELEDQSEPEDYSESEDDTETVDYVEPEDNPDASDTSDASVNYVLVDSDDSSEDLTPEDQDLDSQYG